MVEGTFFADFGSSPNLEHAIYDHAVQRQRRRERIAVQVHELVYPQRHGRFLGVTVRIHEKMIIEGQLNSSTTHSNPCVS